MPVIDLNSDIGEGYGAWPGGPDDELAPLITSANVACGFHAGDPGTIRRTVALAMANQCAIGAQVSYPDLAGFGRRFIDMAPPDLTDAVVYQLGALEAFARVAGTRVRYVKPHGALYNAIVHHHAQAEAVVAAIVAYDPSLPVLGLPGSAVESVCAAAGVVFVPEGFADRAYQADGSLVPRSQSGSLITDPVAAAEQALALASSGVASICVHSDTPGAAQVMSAVARAVASAGYRAHTFAP